MTSIPIMCNTYDSLKIIVYNYLSMVSKWTHYLSQKKKEKKWTHYHLRIVL